MTIKFYNSLTNQKEDFVPIREGEVGLYVCGMTVYDNCHLGHARAMMAFDILARYLRYQNYKVNFIRNITDIDDKIIDAAISEKLDINEITKRSTKQYHSDMVTLNVEEPDREPYATEHISEMINFIEDLLRKKNAYESDKHILFDIDSYNNYGELSGRNPKDMIAGSRVEVQSYKRNPLDFVLWKPSKDNEIGWPSPWGKGRPGWHLECSTMILKIFGETIDIHGGGEDLRFPHHENECAQSFCRNDGMVLANYWMHNGMVQMENSKMSKSSGNILLIKDLIKDVPGEVIRLALISAHYRQPLKWSNELIDQSKKTLQNMYSFLKEFEDDNLNKVGPDAEFIDALSDDLNTPKAISIIHSMFKELKKSPKDINLRSRFIKSANFLGLLMSKPSEWGFESSDSIDEKTINDLIEKRNQARKDKNFEESDQIREQLLDMGVTLEDNEDDTVWRKN